MFSAGRLANSFAVALLGAILLNIGYLTFVYFGPEQNAATQLVKSSVLQEWGVGLVGAIAGFTYAFFTYRS